MIDTTIAPQLPLVALERFCQRWHIRVLSLFGSALRSDFRPESDFDFLVEFEPEVGWSLLDHVKMIQELEELLERKVDLVTRSALLSSANRQRRDAILQTARPIITSE